MIAAGGRIDVGFTQPTTGVRVGLEGEAAAIALQPNGAAAPVETDPTGSSTR